MVESNTIKYVPAVKWRKGEKLALKYLDAQLKKQVAPLIELVNDEGDRPEDLSNDISAYWGDQPAYLDVYYRPQHFGRTALDNITLHMQGIDIIPVARLTSPQIILEGVKNVAGIYNNGIAIRIELTDDQKLDMLKHETELLLKEMNMPRGKVDLIIDFGRLENDARYKTMLTNLVTKLGMDDWRRVIITAGNFPPTLTEFKPNADNYLARAELQLWKQHKSLLGRDSIYSDYTVRYPANLLKGGKGSKSVRYTLPDSYQIFRGTLDDKPFKYLAHSLNIKTLHSNEYPSDYSWGDAFINEKAAQLEKCLEDGNDPETYTGFTPGGSTDWVTASVNHHMSVVLKNDLDAS